MMLGNTGAFLTGKLPYDAEVEYLESTGTQWIDTGIFVTGQDSCVVTVSITQPASGISDYRQIFGARNGSSSKCVDMMYNAGTLFSNFNDGSYDNRAIVVPKYNVTLQIVASNTERSIYDEQSGVYLVRDITPQSYDFTTLTTALLFAESGNTAAGQILPGFLKIYSAKITDTRTGDLRLDMIPVRFTNEQGVSEGAMYDRAKPNVGMNPDGSARTDGLYRNRGTGAFTIGPDKTA